mgnify:CR=1 FL=1
MYLDILPAKFKKFNLVIAKYAFLAVAVAGLTFKNTRPAFFNFSFTFCLAAAFAAGFTVFLTVVVFFLCSAFFGCAYSAYLV